MKELSIEEKTRRYDKALEKARQLCAYPTSKPFISDLQDLFPELKESEDERIRKALLEMVHDTTGDSLWIDYNVHKEDALAWLEKQKSEEINMKALLTADKLAAAEMTGRLKERKDIVENPQKYGLEKQGEQKTADNAEPKFHEGDWVVHHGTENVYQVVALIDNQYQLKYGDNYTVQKCDDVDRCARLWDITKDAKDGDVLSWDDSKCIALFKNIYDEESFNSYGLVGHCTGTFELRQSYHDIEGAHPATKEQRDLLFQKMKEAGYEWDADEKQLKKIVQIPAWSKEDDVKINRIVACLENLNVADNDILLKDVAWLKSLKERYTWRPSDEQMEALDSAIHCYVGISPTNNREVYALEIMKDKLKKLREE